ncbi:MAG: ABC transporter permease [Muribaculaceae bacterium]
MNKDRFFLIVRREYLETVAKKSFIVMTLLTPILIVLLGGVPILLEKLNKSDIKTVALIDETDKYASAIENDDAFRFELVEQASEGNPRQLYDSRGDELYAIVVIPRDVERTHQVLVYSESSVNSVLMSHLEHSMSQVLSDAKIASYGIDGLDKILKECKIDIDVRSIKWSDDGDEQTSSTELAMLIGVILSLASYMFVIMYGSMIMNSVIEEKSNRIVEVIVSSCKPIELMLGKILGVALVGLTQMLIWSVLLGIIGGIAGMSFLGGTETQAVTDAMAQASTSDASVYEMLTSINYLQILAYFAIYFVGGFLLYASLFAAFGSAVDQASDASQFTTPVVMIIVVALYAAIACMENPDGDIAFWCSMIPFTSPMVMMVRLPFDVPAWQSLLSIGILYASAIGLTALSARIYRTGILLYGRKNSIKDLIKWLK